MLPVQQGMDDRAVDYEFGESTDGTEQTFAYSEWMREGPTIGPTTFEIVRSRADGWFRADIWGVQQKRQELRWRKAESFKRIALARQNGIHVLTCGRCETASPLDAAGWRLVRDRGLAHRVLPRLLPSTERQSAGYELLIGVDHSAFCGGRRKTLRITTR
jgi:hypothetical protein